MFVAREQAIAGNRILEESKMAQSQRRDEKG